MYLLARFVYSSLVTMSKPSSTNAISMHELRDQPRWIAGRQFMHDKNYESAIEMFGQLVQDLETAHGTDAEIVAPAWYEYGNALLAAEEENPANDVLGDVKKYAKETVGEGLGDDTFNIADDDADDVDEEEDSNDQPDGEGDANEKEEEEEEDADGNAEQQAEDMQLAWECLEVKHAL